VATAWTHDLIASDHPLFAGRPGTIGTRAGNFCTQNADCVIVIGSRLNIRQVSYNWDSFAKDAFIAQVDADPAELAKPFVQPHLRLACDARLFIDALAAACADGLPDVRPWSAWCRDIRARYPVGGAPTDAPQLHPYALVERIFDQLRDDDIVVCGNASACILPFQVGRLKAGQRMFSNSGSASMGYDLPAAIGAARAAGGRRVVCFAGDGSLQMNIQELQTLATLGLDVLIVLIDNGGYLSIRQTHENFFGRIVGATPASGVEFPDFARVAAAYGWMPSASPPRPTCRPSTPPWPAAARPSSPPGSTRRPALNPGSSPAPSRGGFATPNWTTCSPSCLRPSWPRCVPRPAASAPGWVEPTHERHRLSVPELRGRHRRPGGGAPGRGADLRLRQLRPGPPRRPRQPGHHRAGLRRLPRRGIPLCGLPGRAPHGLTRRLDSPAPVDRRLQPRAWRQSRSPERGLRERRVRPYPAAPALFRRPGWRHGMALLA
jgi:hypothetical protein